MASRPPGTVRAAIAWVTNEIRPVSETPRLDAELLLAYALGRSRDELMLGGEDLPADPLERLRSFVHRRREDREPVAYIIGVRHFRRLALAVDRRALIPRPETELLVETAIELPSGASVLDVGTGTGAVALAIKDERPDLDVAGSDVSAGALELAAENGRRLGLTVEWLRADLLSGLPGRFDAIVCNPPYVAEGEREALAPEITWHEPAIALFAGEDGLDVVRDLLSSLAPRAGARAHARTRVPTAADAVGQADRDPADLGGGDARPTRVALEVGAGQAGVVSALVRGAGFPAVRTLRDLAGTERVVVGERP